MFSTSLSLSLAPAELPFPPDWADGWQAGPLSPPGGAGALVPLEAGPLGPSTSGTSPCPPFPSTCALESCGAAAACFARRAANSFFSLKNLILSTSSSLLSSAFLLCSSLTTFRDVRDTTSTRSFRVKASLKSWRIVSLCVLLEPLIRQRKCPEGKPEGLQERKERKLTDLSANAGEAPNGQPAPE